MSRVGRKIIAVPAGVQVSQQAGVLSVKGPRGALSLAVPAGLRIQAEPGKLAVLLEGADPDLPARQGLCRSLIANMLLGVTAGYRQELEIQGVGFKAAVQGQKMIFNLGFARPVEMTVPAGVEVKVFENVNLTVSGPDKQQVGNLAARIKALFPAEPYKGKGIRFKGEYVRRKAGKTVA